MQHFFDEPSLLATPAVARENRGDGSFVLRCAEPLAPYSRCVGEWLEKWAVETPDAVVFGERSADGAWRRITWQHLRHMVGRIAQSLLDLDLPRGRPIAILSDNGIDHAVLMLAAMHVGIPPCAVSSAYSRSAKDLGRIRSILETLQPSLIFASDGKGYGAAMSCCNVGAVLVASQEADSVSGAISFDRLLDNEESGRVMERFHDIRPDDHAKYLLTSGSTGTPKVVVNTHRMLCANQQMIAQVWRFLEVEKPVLLDWLPWSHTFGGNHNFNMVLRHGGTLYVDDGRPMPQLIQRTVDNLRDCKPTLHFNVPRGLDMLLPALETDEALARGFLGNLRGIFYAGAALPQATWERLQALATKVRGRPLWLTTSWGSTETAPAVTSAHFWLDGAGCIGVPLPGVELKFVPNGGKLELRVRGEAVFPGYRNAPDLTAKAFDEEGYYLIGDAGRLVDDLRPEKGVEFDGRVAEDFKLSTGTWVSVGTLRVKLVSALSPYAQDAVIAGHDTSEIGALVFLSAAGMALPQAERQSVVKAALRSLRDCGGGSSSFPTRVLLMETPPDPDAGEITDKGYVNQKAVLSRRADAVAALYSPSADPRVIQLDPG